MHLRQARARRLRQRLGAKSALLCVLRRLGATARHARLLRLKRSHALERRAQLAARALQLALRVRRR